jgi:AraC-like DNA-binding protein
MSGRTRVGRCPRQDTASNGQETESLNLPAALCCGMKMQTTPSPRLKTVGSREGNRAEPVEIWKARNFIHAHSDEELSLTRVAKAANISPNYLSEKFRQVTGVNFVKYVARTRYENARVLLHDVDLRISEIAFATGFQSLSQFNRVFKKFSGKSPTEYRSLARAKGKRRRRVRSL